MIKWIRRMHGRGRAAAASMQRSETHKAYPGYLREGALEHAHQLLRRREHLGALQLCMFVCIQCFIQ